MAIDTSTVAVYPDRYWCVGCATPVYCPECDIIYASRRAYFRVKVDYSGALTANVYPFSVSNIYTTAEGTKTITASVKGYPTLKASTTVKVMNGIRTHYNL